MGAHLDFFLDILRGYPLAEKVCLMMEDSFIPRAKEQVDFHELVRGACVRSGAINNHVINRKTYLEDEEAFSLVSRGIGEWKPDSLEQVALHLITGERFMRGRVKGPETWRIMKEMCGYSPLSDEDDVDGSDDE